MKLICEICYSYIGQFDQGQLYQPMAGAMFTSAHPRRQVPAPFAASLGWVDMRCPVCGKRPMIKPARVMVAHPSCFETSGQPREYLEVPEQPRPAPVNEVDLGDEPPAAVDPKPAPVPIKKLQADEPTPPAPDACVCAVCGGEYTSHDNLMRYHNPCPELAKGNED